MGAPLIALEGLKKTYVTGDMATPVLHGIDLSVEAGEFVALMGPSGSGKSTLMHVMGFLDHATEGAYRFGGRDVSRLGEDELSLMRRTAVGFVFQAFNLLPKSTVYDNVLLPLVYAGVPNGERKRRALAAIEQVGLTHRAMHLSSQLSGGEKQRVAIARAVVNEPSVIFADEPTGNLDSKSGTAILNLLQALNEEGHTIVMVTHETEAAEYARRIVRLRDGLIIGDARDFARRKGEYQK